MPKISLYKPEKGNNYRFIDRNISQMFTMGGTDCHIHKYIGPKTKDEGTADQPVYDTPNVTQIQDLLFLETRDRKYDMDVYHIRGLYNVRHIDFNLSQFGLFLDNDTISLTVHINDFIEIIGRKPLSGDVVEFPHLRDDFALNDFEVSMPRYYVVEDVTRASDGFSVTWYAHLYRLKLKKITDSQQFSDILDKPASETSNLTLRELLSTRDTEMAINDAIIGQAEADAPKSGYETSHYYTLARTASGFVIYQSVDDIDLDASHDSNIYDETGTRIGGNISASSVHSIPMRSGYTGYLLGDGVPLNGALFGKGIQFPANPAKDDFYLRTDYIPNRLYRFAGKRWRKVEDDVRMTLSQTDKRSTGLTKFINNTEYAYSDVILAFYVNATKDQFIIDTEIRFTTAKYVLMKFRPPEGTYIEMDFDVSEHHVLVPYTDSAGLEKLRIALPVIDNEQHAIPLAGTWRVELCNSREPRRQSISKALRKKPQADL